MLTGGISLAIGAMVSLGAVIAATTMAGPLGVAGGVRPGRGAGTGAVIGALTGAIVALLRLPAIIVTLAGSFIIGGAALLILPRPGGAVPDWLSDLLAGNHPTAFVLLILLVIAWKLYRATPLGLGLYRRRRQPGRRLSAPACRSTPRADRRLCDQRLLTALAGLFVAAQTGSGDPVIGDRLHAELDRRRGARRRRLPRRPGHHARRARRQPAAQRHDQASCSSSASRLSPNMSPRA